MMMPGMAPPGLAGMEAMDPVGTLSDGHDMHHLVPGLQALGQVDVMPTPLGTMHGYAHVPVQVLPVCSMQMLQPGAFRADHKSMDANVIRAAPVDAAPAAPQPVTGHVLGPARPLAVVMPSAPTSSADHRGSDAPVDEQIFKSEGLRKAWTVEEDEKLRDLVDTHGTSHWSLIAAQLPGRNGKQCRERWHNQLDKTIKKGPWTPEEEAVLIAAHKRHGNKWAEIAKELPGRTDSSVKNHWNAALRKRDKQQLLASKRKLRDEVLRPQGPEDMGAVLARDLAGTPSLVPTGTQFENFVPDPMPAKQLGPMRRGACGTVMLHAMLRVTNLDTNLDFFGILGFAEVGRWHYPDERCTNVHLSTTPDLIDPELELLYHWDGEDAHRMVPSRNFGYLAFGVDEIYMTCETFLSRGIAILRPPRDGQTAYVKSPDGISIKLLQKGGPKQIIDRWQFRDAGEI